MLIDVHSHFIPPEGLEYLLSKPEVFGTTTTELHGMPFLRFASGGVHPLTPGFTDIDRRLADMDRQGVDVQVLSVSPAMFYYEADAEYSDQLARICNDYAYKITQQYPDRFRAMADVAMQDMDLALKELRRVHEEYHMNAVETAAILPGIMPDDDYMMPFYEYCEKESVTIFLHPTFTGTEPPYDRYYNMNLIGYVQETNWALNRLIFGGVFERFPDLRILACHGGGLFPYQFGRLVHGWQVRPETKVSCPKSPENYLGNIYYDSVTHSTKSLRFLIEGFGADRVLTGTDYPYDMADDDPAQTLRSLELDPDTAAMIAHKTAEAVIC